MRRSNKYEPVFLNKEAKKNADILNPHKKNTVCNIKILGNVFTENGLCAGKDLPQKINHPHEPESQT